MGRAYQQHTHADVETDAGFSHLSERPILFRTITGPALERPEVTSKPHHTEDCPHRTEDHTSRNIRLQDQTTECDS